MKDDEALTLLSIFHYVVGGLGCLFSCMPLAYVGLGLLMVYAPEKLDGGGDAPPEAVGWFLVATAAVFILIGFAASISIILSGRFLAKRTRYLFSLIIGGAECIFIPFGTVLGIFTIVVLLRDSVKATYEKTRGDTP